MIMKSEMGRVALGAFLFLLLPALAAKGEPKMTEKRVETATVAGGCFWCVESDMEKVPGVLEVVSGFGGGSEKNPSYKMVSSGKTKHREAVRIYFDPSVISYREVLEHFVMSYDPTDARGSFNDRGPQYTSAIFYHNEEQKKIAEDVLKRLNESGRFSRPVVTPVLPFSTFYDAEEYHQDYYKKNPLRYKTFRFLSGRDKFIKTHWGEGRNNWGERCRNNWGERCQDNWGERCQDSWGERCQDSWGKRCQDSWGERRHKNRPRQQPNRPRRQPSSDEKPRYFKPDDETLKQTLTDLQYRVTQKEATERPFNNEYWDNTKEGIYADIVSGEPLFSSKDKYKSGTGWPSFVRPLESSNIVELEDRKLFVTRTELRSKHGDSHLGHVFDDGPRPTGLRYCINSAALRFIPKEALEAEGYGEYLPMFALKS